MIFAPFASNVLFLLRGFLPGILLWVLSFLLGPPFEPLSSCFLQDLSCKVPFLVALASAYRVGELQAVSFLVSFSGSDIFFSYLRKFRAKSESAVIPRPRFFRVCSLRDFVGDLSDALLVSGQFSPGVFRSHILHFSSSLFSVCFSSRSYSTPFQKRFEFLSLECHPSVFFGFTFFLLLYSLIFLPHS